VNSMVRNERHVVKNPKSGWDVKKPHSKRVSSHEDTKAEANNRAREICINQKAECVIHGEDGKIQNSNSYGKDPCPPKDKK
jgi:uncharacterized protein YdaT